MSDTKIFADIALLQMPRILGFLDRDKESRTFGCFDRNFWHYKILDFPNSRFQESVLVLSLAYLLKEPDNRFYKSDRIKNWIIAGIKFWAKSRHKDGSTDENYPFERHFCSTAFSFYAITESLLMLNEKLNIDLINTGPFLLKNDRLEVSNQMAAAALSLYNLYLLTEREKFHSGCWEKIELLLKAQDKYGFYPEYEGFDLGYCSITLSLLALLYKKTKKEKIKESALACIKKMIPYIDEDGYFSSLGMSRKTQFLYTFGFCVFNKTVLDKIEAGLKKNVILNPAWMDDRYCIPFTADYLMTTIENSKCL